VHAAVALRAPAALDAGGTPERARWARRLLSALSGRPVAVLHDFSLRGIRQGAPCQRPRHRGPGFDSAAYRSHGFLAGRAHTHWAGSAIDTSIRLEKKAEIPPQAG
jgi:hypothetical protein